MNRDEETFKIRNLQQHRVRCLLLLFRFAISSSGYNFSLKILRSLTKLGRYCSRTAGVNLASTSNDRFPLEYGFRQLRDAYASPS